MTLRPLSAALAVLFLAASCTSGTEGIFASIEREQKIVSKGGLSKFATIDSMAQIGTKYLATGGASLFVRSTDPSATAWTATTVGGQSKIKSVGTAGSKAYAVAVDAGGLFETPDGDTWNSSALTLAPGDVPYSLVPVRKGDGTSNELVLVTSSGTGRYGDVYVLKSDGTISAQIKLQVTDPSTNQPTTSVSPLVAAVFDGTNYVFANNTNLWSIPVATPAGPAMAVSVSKTVTPQNFGGFIYVSGTYFLGTGSTGTTGGGIYQSTDLAAWTPVATKVTLNSLPVAFRSFLVNPSTGKLWVGTGNSTMTWGSGFMVVSGGNLSTTPPESETDKANYSSSSLATYCVGILFDGRNSDSTKTLFLGTEGHGLWAWDPATKKWSQQ